MRLWIIYSTRDGQPVVTKAVGLFLDTAMATEGSQYPFLFLMTRSRPVVTAANYVGVSVMVRILQQFGDLSCLLKKIIIIVVVESIEVFKNVSMIPVMSLAGKALQGHTSNYHFGV